MSKGNKAIDLIGQKFGKLTVIERAESYISPKGQPVAQWRCKCDCGNEVIVRGNNLKSGRTKSCGCNRLNETQTKGVYYNKKNNKWSVNLHLGTFDNLEDAKTAIENANSILFNKDSVFLNTALYTEE